MKPAPSYHARRGQTGVMPYWLGGFGAGDSGPVRGAGAGAGASGALRKIRHQNPRRCSWFCSTEGWDGVPAALPVVPTGTAGVAVRVPSAPTAVRAAAAFMKVSWTGHTSLGSVPRTKYSV